MREIANAQIAFYHTDRAGASQACNLCGVALVPRYVYEADLQRAANEIIRINDELRDCFVEKDGKVYVEHKPFQEQTFEVLHFDSREELDTWAGLYATVPLKLEVRSEGDGIPKDAWKMGTPSPTLVKNMLLHNASMTIKRLWKRIKIGNGCCEIKLVYLPDACGALIKVHHVVSDGWGMMLAANQFVQLINGETPVAYKYEDFLKSEEAYHQSKRFERDRAFFEQQRERCNESTPLWPVPITNFAAVRTSVRLEKDETELIKEYAKEHGTSPYNLFLTAASIFAGRKLNRNTFYLGSVAINRTGTHEMNTAGVFVTCVPLLIELQDDTTFADAVELVQRENFSCFRHAKGQVTDPNTPGAIPYDLFMSYQNGVLDTDPTATCAQYYCNFANGVKVLSIEERTLDGHYRMHLDHNIEIPVSEVNEMYRVMLAVLRDGIADDSKKITELGK